MVPVYVSATDLEAKWDRLLPLSAVSTDDTEDSHAVVARGEDLPSVLTRRKHNPEIVIIDGGALHATTTLMLRTRGMRLHSRVRHSMMMVWMAKRRHVEEEVFDTTESLATAIDGAMQRRMRHACDSMGDQRFRRDIQEEDVHRSQAADPPAVYETSEWGDQEQAETARCKRFWDWPDEPATEEAPTGCAELSGIEVEKTLTTQEAAERAADLLEWKKEGQTWWGAMTADAQTRMRLFFDANERTNDAVAEAVALLTKEGDEGPNFEDFSGATTKNEVMVTQEECRPGARGKTWSWLSGECVECTPGSIENEVTAAGGHTCKRVQEVAGLLDFPDRRSTQVLTSTGTTHGTVQFPLRSHAGRNHQGAGKHHAKITKMIAGNVPDGQFASQHGSDHPARPIPAFHPFGIAPLNGSVARQKELEDYEKERDGFDIGKVVRGTYNGSFPHDGSSPNDLCIPEEGTQKEWACMRHMVRNASILRAIGAPTVEGFKLDLKAAYTQLFHQLTQRWRQTIYWKWKEGDDIVGGFMTHVRCEWGQAMSGTWFHRAVTSLMVRWIEKALLEEWVPTIKCEVTRQWVKDRLEMYPEVWERSPEEAQAEKDNPKATGRRPKNRNSTQGVPGFCQGFLDGFWTLVAGTTEDVASARRIVMKAFDHVGFIVSKSKLLTEGTPDPEIVILGHDVNLSDGTRGVTAHKRVRIQDQIKELGPSKRWSRKLLERLIGLLQSVREDVDRRWNLTPLYQIMRRRPSSSNEWVFPTRRAREALVKVLATLHERRSLSRRKTRWIIPTAPTLLSIVNTDASSLQGLGGAVLLDGILEYFGEKWRDDTRAGLISDGERKPLIDIAVLEALTVTVAAATWGHRWSGRKMVMRSDSSPTCFSFNKLASRDPTMVRVTELWEDIQFYYHFEGLLVHCKGEINELADRASRLDEALMQEGMEEAARLEELPITECRRLPSVWSFGTTSIDVLDELIKLTKQANQDRSDKAASQSLPPPTNPHSL
jgi:hypothetical protein